MAETAAADFTAKWQGVTASELSTSQSFLIDLCRLLEVDAPHATAEQDYMFERPITFAHGDGSSSAGRIDLYRRGAFVLESKKLKAGVHTKGFDEALLRARSQAENYARALPASEGRPPFVVVVDVGNRIELYAEFSRSGATYTPFPDPRSHRIALKDLQQPEILDRLRRVWVDPLSLDPSRESARVTREIATRLARLARSLEGAGHAPEAVAQFLMRCLFTMFAEDVRLLPAESFRDLLLKHAAQPPIAMRMLAQLWQDMDRGGFSAVLANEVLRFNGKLFKQPDTLPLNGEQLQLLADAAKADWRHVEPAIFGTLLERALDPGERHKLGAHYTPRAYVERLVLPTVIEPLREEWAHAQAAALTLAAENKHDAAVQELRRFHHRLCTLRVLDPACGSGNFLYVTLEHLKRLEGEVLNVLDELGFRQTGLALGGERADAAAGETVDPHNLLGIELNPRAAAIAEVVLWIGYLQWHYRTRGDIQPPQPVIRDFRNIECRDAVLDYDGVEYVTDEHGIPITRWDGHTMKPSPVTGEPIPDDRARIPLERYLNPRKAEWPEADFVVGNPPFIGTKRMKAALGQGYVEALRRTWSDVPESADLVMYWWHLAAELTQADQIERFGLISTNSLSQTFNRKTVESALSDRSKPLSLVFAVPDHPWVDSADGAAVRISMTVCESGSRTGVVGRIVGEGTAGEDAPDVELAFCSGIVHADLKVGANVAAARALRANGGIAGMGVALHGSGFILDPDVGKRIREDGANIVRGYVAGRDLLQERRERYLIDFSGMTETEARRANPSAYQHVVDYVLPEREHNKREPLKRLWWRFGWERPVLRTALRGLTRYIGTTETSKHRPFQFIDIEVLADHSIVCVASDDAELLGILSSTPHLVWALALGGRLGVGNDPRYNKTRCFEPFPFPAFNNDPHPSGATRQPPSPDGRGIHGSDLASAPIPSPDGRGIHGSDSVSAPIPSPDGRGIHGSDSASAPTPSPDGRGIHGSDLASAPIPSPDGRRWPAGPDEGAGEPSGAQRKPKLPANLLAFARQLRQQQTDAETKLWFLLRDRRFLGLKFRRQAPMQPYILDFYCHELRLAVELDGGQHNAEENREKDRARSQALAARGVLVVRFWNDEFLRHVEGALEALYVVVRDRQRELATSEAALSGPADQLLSPGEGLRARVRALAESLDAHRKRQQAAHPKLTLTGMYNVLEKLRSGEVLSVKEREIHEQGLVSVLRQIHDELDAAVLEAYGWSDLLPLLRVAHGNTRAATPVAQVSAAHLGRSPDEAPGCASGLAGLQQGAEATAKAEQEVREQARREFDEAILERLVALNAERAAEEARGMVRWLRPEFQNPQGTGTAQPEQAEIDTDSDTETETAAAVIAPTRAKPWPKDAIEQVRAVADALSSSPIPLSVEQLASRFNGRGPWKKRLPQLLDMLVALGKAQAQNDHYSANR